MIAFPLGFPFCFVPVRWSDKWKRWRFSFSVYFALAKSSLLKFVSRLVRSVHRVRAMSFSGEKVLGALGKIPGDGFLAKNAEVQAKWLHFVASLDADPKNLHDVMFYAIGALLSATMRLASCNTFSSQDHAEAGFAKTGIAQFWHRLSLC